MILNSHSKSFRFVKSALKEWIETTETFLKENEPDYDDPNRGWDFNDTALIRSIVKQMEKEQSDTSN